MSGGALWLPNEDALLIQLYRRGHPRKEVAARLGRSVDAVDARRRAVGCEARTQRRPWQAGEDELLRAARTAAIPASEVAPRLGRSIEAVWLRSRQLGLSRTAARPYSADDDRTLRRCWDGGVGLAHLPRELGRSADALRLRARQLGLASPPRRQRWRPEDDRLLREGYAQGLTCAAIATTLLPERTAGESLRGPRCWVSLFTGGAGARSMIADSPRSPPAAARLRKPAAGSSAHPRRSDVAHGRAASVRLRPNGTRTQTALGAPTRTSFCGARPAPISRSLPAGSAAPTTRSGEGSPRSDSEQAGSAPPTALRHTQPSSASESAASFSPRSNPAAASCSCSRGASASRPASSG